MWTAWSRKGGDRRQEHRRERRKGSRARAGGAAGAGTKKGARWSWMCRRTGPPTGGRCLFGSTPITSVMGVTENCNPYYMECPRPRWTSASFKRQKWQVRSTPAGRLDIALLRRTRQADTAAEWQYPPAGAALCGGGCPAIWSQRHWIPAGYRGAAMVHRGMLPRPWWNLDNREGRRSAQGAPQGSRAAGGGEHERELGGARWRPEGGGYRGRFGDGGTRGHVGACPPATAPLVRGREDVEYATKGEGGAVLDGLYPGDGLPSLWKRLRP